MTKVRAQAFAGMFAFTAIGNTAAATMVPDEIAESENLAHPSHTLNARDSTQTSTTLHWGDPLRPHHFRFDQGTAVRPRLTTRPDILCHAVSVIGAGSFKENDDSMPVEFCNGGIIVNGGERYKFFTFEVFQKHCVLANGDSIVSLFQIDFQAPKK